MKLSTRGRYGTRAMLELALHGHGEPMMLRAIAENQHLPPKYLEQLLRMLKHAGLVRVVRGSKGGFLLAREPEAITLTDVLDALEGDLAVVECVTAPDFCEHTAECVAREVWSELTNRVYGYLDSLTLADLVRRCEERSQRPCPPGVRKTV